MAKKNYTREEAYIKSIKVLKKCQTPYGFVAAASKKQRYERIWSRDGIISGLGALLSEDEELISCFKKTLETLSKYQHKFGYIPSNVNPGENKVSFGGSTGRVDANIWYVIGMGQYYKRTKDKNFIRKHINKIEKIIEILNHWEFNDKYFIYIPISGDWADEYISEGYILYDQLLYLQAIKDYIFLEKEINRKNKRNFKKEYSELKKMISINYWLDKENLNSEKVYNKVIFQKGLNNKLNEKRYLLPYFNPGGYGKKFDGLANSLALIMNILPKDKKKSVVEYINKKFSLRTKNLIPSFWPPIKPEDPEYNKLKNNYSIRFKNKPYYYHNGGLWTFINGFYAAAVAEFDKEKAKKHLDAINWANYKAESNNKWGFYEFINSKNFKPGGMKYQAWSAAGAIMAHQTVINNKKIFL